MLLAIGTFSLKMGPIQVFVHSFLVWFGLNFIYLSLTVLGLHCCMRAFSSCRQQGLLSSCSTGFSLQWLLLLWSTSALAVPGLPELRLTSCSTQTWLLQGMWDLPRPGIKPMSPAFAGRFFTTKPPGKPLSIILIG